MVIKMYNRVKKLYNTMLELNFKAPMGVEHIYQTSLGDRTIHINKFTKDLNNYSLSSQTYYWLDFYDEKKKIFRLEVYRNEIKIQPCPIPLTAHEIDLAILEFENHINKIYSEHKAKQEELSEV